MSNFKNKLHNIPLWAINLITVISGIITILTPIVTVILFLVNYLTLNILFIAVVIIMIMFNIIMFLRVKKYRQISQKRMEGTSSSYHKLMHEVRDTYFDVMHSHKKGTLTIDELSAIYINKFRFILDTLCEIMNTFTERNISACIKLISYNTTEEVIDIDNAALVTFCRSSHSDTGRSSYEMNREILIKDNTDFLEIVDENNGKDYFYQGDLRKYAQKLKDIGRSYENTNKQWENYYIGTIIVPIRIEFKRLYHQKKDNAYHIIGFLCIDSLSTDAFTDKQEKYNVNIANSFADIIYVLLAQYRHYLKKFA